MKLNLTNTDIAVSSADSSANVDIVDVIGSKSDTFTGSSLMSKMQRSVGYLVTKTLTCNGDGAQADNIFTLTGAVEVLDIWGVCTEATNATDLAACSFALYDSTATVEITDSGAPTDCSGITVGDVVIKNGASATVALTYLNNVVGVVSDVVSSPFRIVKKTAANTYIQFLFNGDVNTDVDIKFYVRYIPKSDDGALVAA